MEKQIKNYLLHTTLNLNGQLRGAINKKGKEENHELIAITLYNVFEEAYNLGKSTKEEEEALDKLKKDLDIKPDKNGKRKK